MWHAFNDEPEPIFIERGNITVSSVRSGASVIGQNGLLQSHINELKNLAKNDGKYRLKAIARTSSGNEITFLSSVPAVITFLSSFILYICILFIMIFLFSVIFLVLILKMS